MILTNLIKLSHVQLTVEWSSKQIILLLNHLAKEIIGFLKLFLKSRLLLIFQEYGDSIINTFYLSFFCVIKPHKFVIDLILQDSKQDEDLWGHIKEQTPNVRVVLDTQFEIAVQLGEVLAANEWVQNLQVESKFDH
jgi:hypothetical protein